MRLERAAEQWLDAPDNNPTEKTATPGPEFDAMLSGKRIHQGTMNHTAEPIKPYFGPGSGHDDADWGSPEEEEDEEIASGQVSRAKQRSRGMPFNQWVKENYPDSAGNYDQADLRRWHREHTSRKK